MVVEVSNYTKLNDFFGNFKIGQDKLAETVNFLPNLEAVEWSQFRPCIQVYEVYKLPNGVRGVLLKYDPGASAPEHRHIGYEHIYVVQGSQEDCNGVYGAGSEIVNPPGTCHQPMSSSGCIVFIVYEKPVEFL